MLLTLFLCVYLCSINQYVVTAVCTDGTAEHKNAFKSFVENELQCKVIWVSTKTDLQLGSKYLLLCNVTSRIPDDLDFFLKELSIKGNFFKMFKVDTHYVS